MDKATAGNEPIEWGVGDCDHGRTCRPCSLTETAIHRTAAYMYEWAEAIDEIASRVRQGEENRPEAFLQSLADEAAFMHPF